MRRDCLHDKIKKTEVFKMIVNKKMYAEFSEEYEKEAIKIYENMKSAIDDFRNISGNYAKTEKQIEDTIKDGTNCDWKVMPDGRVFCSYQK